jgi:spermidine synthase
MARIELQQRKFSDAIGRLEIVTRTQPRNADAWGLLGTAYSGAKIMDEAIASFERALALRPGLPLATDQLAWILATEPKFLDPAKAVALAEGAVRSQKAGNPRALDTLAAAYAAEGRFDDAVESAEKALAEARRSGPAALEAGLKARLARYRARQTVVGP